MTATVRGGDRTSLDTYPTPPWCVQSLTGALSLPPGNWLEPSAGQGAIIRAVNRSDVHWSAVEIDPTHEATLRPLVANVYMGDFLETQLGTFDVVIGNPPFSKAPQFVERSLGLANIVVMLLRLSFVSTKGRFHLMGHNAPDMYVLPDRPQFAGTNRDSSDYAWFVWHANQNRRRGILHVLDPVPPANRKPFHMADYEVPFNVCDLLVQ